ncbi:hypothetical protein PIB30_068500 [Stylosanthes scabra]|uniref:Uncharacterized protein n=1 Tax=Stylosanthes scabra TaxID=79078 RepID=A0ABU6WQX0_9FABA|nr:hypothetical protein [Stylosanthes scabra]
MFPSLGYILLLLYLVIDHLQNLLLRCSLYSSMVIFLLFVILTNHPPRCNRHLLPCTDQKPAYSEKSSRYTANKLGSSNNFRFPTLQTSWVLVSPLPYSSSSLPAEYTEPNNVLNRLFTLLHAPSEVVGVHSH